MPDSAGISSDSGRKQQEQKGRRAKENRRKKVRRKAADGGEKSLSVKSPSQKRQMGRFGKGDYSVVRKATESGRDLRKRF